MAWLNWWESEVNALQAEVQKELRRITEDHHGILTPEQVVEEASDPANPLHEEFEWDDAAAAVQHRLDQARALIRSMRVVVTTETIKVELPEYLRDPDRTNREQGYAIASQLRSSRDRAEQALATEINRVSSAAARAREIALALGLQGDVEHQILDAVGAVQPVLTTQGRRRGAA